MTATPFFSIVIPTRNRADLLRQAIRTALNQTFDDYEVVISNNSSTDHTDDVMAEAAGASSRIRHYRTSSTLSMADHWEHVLQYPRGEYVTYLSDDDALAPNALAVAARAIRETGAKFVVPSYVQYVWPSWFDAHRRNSVMLFRFTHEFRTMNSADTLRELYTCRDDVWAPRMLNSFGHRQTLMDIRAEAGRLFWMCPDFSVAGCILAKVPTWLYVDSPLRLYGLVPQSIGASMAYDGGRTHFRNFRKEMGGGDLFQRAPTDAALTPNMICETLLILKERLPEATAGVSMNWPGYFAEDYRYLDMLEANGGDMREERAAVAAALARQEASVQSGVRRLKAKAKVQRLKSALLPQESRARRLAFRLGMAGSFVVRGEEAGFRDIAECAAWIADPAHLP